jgi:hypothetical protein
MSGEDTEARDALQWLKELICINIPTDRINAAAFGALGENPQTLDDDTHELYETLCRQSSPVSHGEAFALTFALREVILDRVREIRNGAA